MNDEPSNNPPTGLDTVGCPTCAAPAAVVDRYLLDSTNGSIEHTTVLCADRHRFTVPGERLTTPRAARKETDRWARRSI